MPQPHDLGLINSIDVINRYVTLAGRFVIDAGCGSMTFTMPLLEHGARVLAIDPDPIQAKLNRQAAPITNLAFLETGAENIPVPDQSVDGLFFSYSLHHIPGTLFPRVFDEVVRVLRPAGFLFVIEPADCPLNEVMRLFHDEDREREAAQRALQELAVPRFETFQEFTYHSVAQYASFQQFADHFASRTFNSLYSEADVRHPRVEEAFGRLAGPDNTFLSPKRVMLLEKVRTAN